MKKLLYVFLCLWVVARADIYENIGLERPSETDGVVLLPLLGDELPLTLFGSAVDHIDTEIVHMTLLDKPHANIGSLVWPDNAHLSIDAARFRDRKVGPVGRLNGNSLVCDMVDGIVLPEAIYRSQQYDNEYGKQPLHVAKIAKN